MYGFYCALHERTKAADDEQPTTGRILGKHCLIVAVEIDSENENGEEQFELLAVDFCRGQSTLGASFSP